MQISNSNFSNPNTRHVKPDDRLKAAIHYKRDGASVWVWNEFTQDWISVSLGGGGGSQTPWTSNINGGGFSLSNATFLGNGTNNTFTGATLEQGGSSSNAVDISSGANSIGIVITDEGFAPGNFQANTGSYGVYVADGAYVKYGAAPDEWGKILHDSANVNTSGVYQKGGVQVVAARGAAVADATDAATAITQLNTLLARLRVHGLISS